MSNQPPFYNPNAPFQSQPPNFIPNAPFQPNSGFRRPTINKLAIISLLTGTVSLLGFFCCCSLFPALSAITTGHIALVQIKRSAALFTGRGLAISGLILGYISLVLSVGFVLYSYPAKDRDTPPNLEVTAASQLQAAERKISSSRSGVGHGNSPEAAALAKEFAELMLEMRNVLFTKKKKIFTADQPFVTYCELREGQCAFLVVVPDYRKFEDDAKDSLAELAWTAAHSVSKKHLKPGDKLAVGMKGVLLYGSVMVGQIHGDDGDPKPNQSGKDEALLFPFFEPTGSMIESEDEPNAMDGIELPPEPSACLNESLKDVALRSNYPLLSETRVFYS